MTIICKICGKIITSLEVDKKKALLEVTIEFGKHLSKDIENLGTGKIKHNPHSAIATKEMGKINNLIGAMQGVLFTHAFVKPFVLDETTKKLDDRQEYFLENYRKSKGNIAMTLHMDEFDEEDEFDYFDDEDDEEGNEEEIDEEDEEIEVIENEDGTFTDADGNIIDPADIIVDDIDELPEIDENIEGNETVN